MSAIYKGVQYKLTNSQAVSGKMVLTEALFRKANAPATSSLLRRSSTTACHYSLNGSSKGNLSFTRGRQGDPLWFRILTIRDPLDIDTPGCYISADHEAYSVFLKQNVETKIGNPYKMLQLENKR